MVRLTEIYQGPAVYNETLDKSVGTYGLREIMINPKYVVVLRAAMDLQNKAANKGGSLIPGVHLDASYTQVLMHCPNHLSTLIINVVGSLSHITEKVMLD